jgi:sulfate permease, SulP family
LVKEAEAKVIILECSAIPDFEYTALQTLTRAEERLRERGVALWLTALNPEALRVVKRSPLGRVLGHERMFATLAHAVAAFQKL